MGMGAYRRRLGRFTHGYAFAVGTQNHDLRLTRDRRHGLLCPEPLDLCGQPAAGLLQVGDRLPQA
jgi:hypothetical protein